MNSFICLLRGINVGGKRPVKMETLRAIFAAAGAQKVRTYIQSGNVVFEMAGNSLPASFEAEVFRAIEATFGFSVPLFFISARELEAILAANPFLKEANLDTAFLHVTLFKEALSEAAVSHFDGKGLPAATFLLTSQCAYLYCPDGYHKFKGGNDHWEKVCGTQATTRNWKTLQQLVVISGEE